MSTGASRRSTLAALSLVLAPPAALAASRQAYEIVLAVDGAGRPTRPWLDAIRDRVSAEEMAAVAASAKPLSTDELRWVELIRQITPVWFKGVDRLNAPFRHVSPPRTVKIVLGHEGGDDAFGLRPDVTAFDLSSLVGAYSDRSAEARAALMTRLLSHEYTHLLVGPQLDRLGWSETWAEQHPFRRALRTFYNEGLGNLRSLEGDDRWVSAAGEPSVRAREALAKLQPIMIQRLQALRADPDPQAAKALLRNISQGPFDGKWGALPIALWLAQDTGFEPARIAPWVEAGPGRILELAVKHGDPALTPAYRDLLASAPKPARS